MMNIRSLVLLVWLLLLFNVPPYYGSAVQAQDPLYRLVSSSSSHRPYAAAVASARTSNSPPWRSQRQQQRSTTRTANDYSIRLLDWEREVRTDPRARIYQVDMTRRRPNQFSMTTQLMWSTILCFGLQMWKPAVTSMGMKISDRILRGEQLYRLVTPIFLHGGVFHLMMNMASLGNIGRDVEKLFGPGRYLSTYMVAGVAGNVVSAIRSPNPSLGASGAVFGIVGAYFCFLSRNDWILGSSGQAVTSSIISTMGTNLLLGLANPRIDQWAHVGGAVAGGAMAYLFGPRLYLTEIPVLNNESARRRVVVDRPVIRAPRSLEALPGKIGKQWNAVMAGVAAQGERLLPQGTHMPWRDQMDSSKKRRWTPNRSIKPGRVD